MNEYLTFQKMIAPIILKGIFWLATVAVVVYGLTTIFGDSFFTGLLIIVLGPLVIRIYVEILIVIFQINNTLTELKDLKTKG